MEKTTNNQYTTDQKSQYAVFGDVEIPKDQIREWTIKDIRGIHILLSEILQSPVCIDAIVDVFYDRYLKLREERQRVPDPESIPENVADDPLGKIKNKTNRVKTTIV